MMTIKEKVGMAETKGQKRRKYSDEYSASSSNLSSVNKLFLIGLLPEAQETYPNLKIILEEINLGKIPHTISSDLKADLTVMGKQQASCSFPCIYCPISKDFVGSSTLLTLGELRAMRAAYLNAGEPHKDAKEFLNVINDILLDGPDDCLVIDIINLPELHIMLGVVGKTLPILDKTLGKDKVNNFLKTLCITREDYHGRSSPLNGNDSKKFLANIEKLELASIEDIDKKESAVKLTKSLSLFDKVVKACFGNALHDDYEQCIQEFLLHFDATGIKKSLKIHLLDHVSEFLERKFANGFPKVGLGFWSEQAFESCHHKWKTHWENCAVGRDHAEYKERLCRAVVNFNCDRI